MRLGEKLVKAGLISPAQLDDALRLQVIYGGRLGTNLIELGALELDALAVALAEQMGVAPALAEHFASPDRAFDTAALLPAALAEQHHAVPLRREPDSGRLAIAFIDPLDLTAVDEIGFATGARVRAHVAPELTVLLELERLYGIPCPARFRRQLPPRLQAIPQARMRTPTPSQPFAASRRPTRRRTPTQPFAAARAPAAPPVIEPPTAPASLPPAPSLSTDDACARLAIAESREDIGDLVLDHLRGWFTTGLIAIVRDDQVLGWKAFAPGPLDPTALAIPLGGPSLLATALGDRALYHGPPPPEGAALDARLWRQLGCAPPAEVVACPILLRDRVVSVVYAHGAPGGAPAEAVAGIQAVCLAATQAFTRLISARKR